MFRPLLTAALLLPMSVIAQDVMVVDAWVPMAPPTTRAHAAYLSLRNQGTTPRVVVGVHADGYAMAHLHESKDTSGVATMTLVHQIEIPAGGLLSMKPGGLHVMLMGPQAPTKNGDKIALTLTFADDQTLTFDAAVRPRDAES